MSRVSNETLLSEIQNIKKDTTEIKEDHKILCEQVNTNRENIASQKSIIKIVEAFIVGICLSIVGLFWGNYK